MSQTPHTVQPASNIPLPKSRRGFKGFFAEVGREMRKVNWPSKPETNRLTGVVLVVCGLIVLILVILNYFWSFVIDALTKGF